MSVLYYGPEGFSANERWQYWKNNRPAAVAVDIETASLEERMPVGIGIAMSPQEAFYFDIHPEPNIEALESLREFLSDIRIVKVAHNWIFDLGVMPLIPVIGETMNRANLFDTIVAARLQGHLTTDLPFLSWEVPGDGRKTRGMAEILRENGCKDNIELLKKNPRALQDHCADDTRVTYRLYLEWKDRIHRKHGEYFKIEMEAIPILMQLSMHGIAIDQAARQELEDRYTMEVEFLYRHIQSFGIENPNSSQQVGYVLAKRGNFLKLTKSKRQLKTSKGELEFIDDPLAAAVLQYRTKAKFLNTYIMPLGGEDRFYTEYFTETAVGRLNSKNRNIQNIPPYNKDTGEPGARFMLMPDNGQFVTGDYSREHLYILAQMSQDRDMLEVLYDPDPRKADIHQHTADLMHVDRRLAKVANFAVVYGATAQTLMEQLKTKDRRLCDSLLEGWFRAYPGAADWIKYAQREGVRDGWSLPTLFGRQIKLPFEREDETKRKAVNYPILGSDGEVIKRAMILSRNRGLAPPVLAITVHDSLTWDGPVENRVPKEELEMIPGFKVPFEIKSTFRWE